MTKRIVALSLAGLLAAQDLSAAVWAVRSPLNTSAIAAPLDVFNEQALVAGMLTWLNTSYQKKLSLRLNQSFARASRAARKTVTHVRRRTSAWLAWSQRHPRLSTGLAVGAAIGLYALQWHGAAHGTLLTAMAGLGIPQSLNPEDEIKKILASRRSLVFSSNADAIDAALLEHTRKNKQPYLRLTLRHQQDLDRLMTRVTAEDGKARTQPGPLRRLIQNGGVLMIDYAQSNPKLVESFNSLFDKRSYFGEDKASPDLIIVGVMTDAQVTRHPASFYSRFHRIFSLELPFEDPLDQIQSVHPDYPPLYRSHTNGLGKGTDPTLPPLPPEAPHDQWLRVQSQEVQLFRGPFFREDLLGHLNINTKGYVHWTLQSAFLNAIQGPGAEYEKLNKPLIIHGADWKDPAFTGFLRQILLTRQFEVNGKIYDLPPDFHVYRADTDFSQGTKQARILAPGESTSSKPLWTINRATQDILFEKTGIDSEGHFMTRGGILDHDSQIPIRLRITERLDDWVWHRIMHEPYVDVEVAPGVYIPKDYSAFRSDAQKSFKQPENQETFEQAISQRSVLIETNDMAVALDRIEQTFSGRQIIHYPITPETTLAELVASVEVASLTDQDMRFKTDRKGILQALEAGAVVVLEGLEINPDLARQLEPALSEQPYLMHYNEGGETLDRTSGHLIVMAKTTPPLDIQAAHRTKITSDDKSVAEILAREFPKRFSSENYEKILRLRRSFESLPAPHTAGLYPAKPDFSLDRLRILLRHENWLEGFDNVFLSQYADDPEAAAFLRTRVRLEFNLEEPGRRPNSLVGHKVRQALNALIPLEDPQKHIWRLADTLSLDLLKELNSHKAIGEDFYQMNAPAVRRVVDRALIKSANGEREAFYRHRAGLERADVSDAADIYTQNRVGEPTWQEQVRKIHRAFDIVRLVMLKGLPGTGKSFIASQIAPQLGYSPDEVFGPITVGSDIKETDIVARRHLANGKTELWEETVARWARRSAGGLLLVDEANLANPAFWNFLSGLFAEKPYVWINGHRVELSKQHRVLFTGNQEFVTGRRYQDLIQRHAITVHFSPFSDSFLRDRIDDNLGSQVDPRESLITLILQLHRLFERVGTHVTFSLRDVEELVARLMTLNGSDWTVKQVVGMAWDQYQGNFDPDQRQALEHLIVQKYGVVIADWEQTYIDALRQEKGAAFKRGRITLVDATARMVASVDDLLGMRAARISKKTVLQGKRGLILEGPSGRGKDDPLDIAMQLDGLQSDRTAPTGTPPEKLFYHRTARPDNNEELLRVIDKAKRDGSVVIISEPNLLPSAFLEGKLNDALTGNAHPGFAFIMTNNSSDFSGRDKYSTALLNRVIYRREVEYSGKELSEILADQARDLLHAGRLSDEDIRHAERAHLWVRDSVENLSLRPTSRELIRLIDLWRDRREPLTADQAHQSLDQIYGPLYLDKILKGKKLPSREWLLNEFKPADAVSPTRMMQHYVNASVRSAQTAVVQLHGANAGQKQMNKPLAYHSSDNSYTVSADAFRDGMWQEGLLHEVGHGRRTWVMPGLTPYAGDPLDPLYQDLEDLRQLAGVAADLPASHMSAPSSAHKGFARMVQALDFDTLIAWPYAENLRLGMREGFSYLLATHAQGLITTEEAQRFAQMTADLFPVNPFQAALPFLDLAVEIAQAFSRVDEVEEHKFQQYRMLTRLHQMQAAYDSLPDWIEEPPVPSVAEQHAAVEEALNELKGADLRPRAAAKQAAAAPKAKPPSPQEAAAKLAAMKKKMAAAQHTSRDEVLKILQQMEDDLDWAGGVTPERLKEMSSHLSDTHDRSHLLLKIRQLNDPKINARLERILRRQQERETGTDSSSWNWGSFGDAMGSLLGFGSRGKGNRLSPIGPRSGWGTHRPDMTRGIVPVNVTPKGIERSTRRLSSVETSLRDPRMAAISRAQIKDLNSATAAFVELKQNPDKVFGPDGILNVERLYETRDPAVSHLRSGPKAEEHPKEIVLDGLWPEPAKSIMLEELFHFLFEKGFTVTVYTDAHTYVDGIRTVGDLKTVMPERASRNLSEVADIQDAIKKDMNARKGKNSYEVALVPDLQRQIEPAYIYGAFKSVLDNKPAASAPQSEPAAQVTETGDFKAQKDQAVQFLKSHNLPLYLLKVNVDKKTMELDLGHQSNLDLGGLYGLKTLTRLNLEHSDFIHYEQVVWSLNGLEWLNLRATNISHVKHLDALTKLSWLDLSQTLVRDTSPIAILKLRELHLEALTLDDYRPLSQIQTLRTLNLAFVKGLKNIDFIEPLNELQSLSLEGVDAGNKHVFYNAPERFIKLRKLQEINLRDTLKLPAYVFYALLDRHPNRDHLRVITPEGYAMIGSDIGTDILRRLELPAVVQKKKIHQWLDSRGINRSALTERDPGEFILNLSGYSKLTSLAGLGSPTRIVNLNLGGTGIKDLRPLAGMRRLEILNLAETLVEDLTPLQGLTMLHDLDLSRTKVRDITPLAGLTHLESLQLLETRVTDIGALRRLKQLLSVSLPTAVISEDILEEWPILSGLIINQPYSKEEIYRYLLASPNRSKLEVLGQKYLEIRLRDVPASYHDRIRGLPEVQNDPAEKFPDPMMVHLAELDKALQAIIGLEYHLVWDGPTLVLFAHASNESEANQVEILFSKERQANARTYLHISGHAKSSSKKLKQRGIESGITLDPYGKYDIVKEYKSTSADRRNKLVFMSRGKTYTYDELAGLDNNSTLREIIKNIQSELNGVAEPVHYWLVADEDSDVIELHMDEPGPLTLKTLEQLRDQLKRAPHIRVLGYKDAFDGPKDPRFILSQGPLTAQKLVVYYSETAGREKLRFIFSSGKDVKKSYTYDQLINEASYQPPAGEVPFEEQKELIKDYLNRHNLPQNSLVPNEDQQLFALDLGDQGLTDDFPFEQLSRLAHLAYSVSYGEPYVTRLAALHRLEVLISHSSIYFPTTILEKLYHLRIVGVDYGSLKSYRELTQKHHPRGTRVEIILKDEAMRRFGHFEEQPPANELSFDDQITLAEQIVYDLGLPQNNLVQGKQWFALNLGGIVPGHTMSALRNLSKLTRLKHLVLTDGSNYKLAQSMPPNVELLIFEGWADVEAIKPDGLRMIGLPNDPPRDFYLQRRGQLLQKSADVNCQILDHPTAMAYFGRFDEKPPAGEMSDDSDESFESFGEETRIAIDLLRNLGLRWSTHLKTDYEKQLLSLDLRGANREIHLMELLPFTRLAHIFTDRTVRGMTTWADAGFPNLTLALQLAAGGNVYKLVTSSKTSPWDVAEISLEMALQLFGNFDLTPEAPPAGELSFEEQVKKAENILRALGVSAKDFSKHLLTDPSAQRFALDLRGIPTNRAFWDHDVKLPPRMAGMTRLVQLHIGEQGFLAPSNIPELMNLELLIGASYLSMLDLKVKDILHVKTWGYPQSKEFPNLQARLAQQAPNLKLISTEEAERRFGRFDDAPPAGELSYEAQVQLALHYLTRHGIPQSNLKRDHDRQVFSLDLGQQDIDSDLPLEVFTRLVHFALDAVPVNESEHKRISALKNLEILVSHGMPFRTQQLTALPQLQVYGQGSTSLSNVQTALQAAHPQGVNLKVMTEREAMTHFGRFDDAPPAGELSNGILKATSKTDLKDLEDLPADPDLFVLDLQKAVGIFLNKSWQNPLAEILVRHKNLSRVIIPAPNSDFIAVKSRVGRLLRDHPNQDNLVIEAVGPQDRKFFGSTDMFGPEEIPAFFRSEPPAGELSFEEQLIAIENTQILGFVSRTFDNPGSDAIDLFLEVQRNPLAELKLLPTLPSLRSIDLHKMGSELNSIDADDFAAVLARQTRLIGIALPRQNITLEVGRTIFRAHPNRNTLRLQIVSPDGRGNEWGIRDLLSGEEIAQLNPPSLAGEMSFEKQVAWVKKFIPEIMAKNQVIGLNLSVREKDQKFDLHTARATLQILEQLPPLSALRLLELRVMDVPRGKEVELARQLARHKDLQFLEFSTEHLNTRELGRQIFLAHPNRNKLRLQVVLPGGQSEGWDIRDLLDDQDIAQLNSQPPAGELSFEEQYHSFATNRKKWGIIRTDPTFEVFSVPATTRNDLKQLRPLPALRCLNLNSMDVYQFMDGELASQLARHKNLQVVVYPVLRDKTRILASQIMRAHPNRNNLIVQVSNSDGSSVSWDLYDLLSDTEIAQLTTANPSIKNNLIENGHARMIEADRAFLSQLLSSLVDPKKTLPAVRKRFAEHDQAEAFDALVREVSPGMANYANPSSQSPLARTIGTLFAPEVLTLGVDVTRLAGYRLTGFFAASAIAVIYSPWIAAGIAGFGLLTHFLHDLPRFRSHRSTHPRMAAAA